MKEQICRFCRFIAWVCRGLFVDRRTHDVSPEKVWFNIGMAVLCYTYAKHPDANDGAMLTFGCIISGSGMVAKFISKKYAVVDDDNTKLEGNADSKRTGA